MFVIFETLSLSNICSSTPPDRIKSFTVMIILCYCPYDLNYAFQNLLIYIIYNYRLACTGVHVHVYICPLYTFISSYHQII